MKGFCAIHLAGNLQCPYQALWRVEGEVNEPRAYESTPPSFRTVGRLVCAHHLEQAILAALENVPLPNRSVRVSLT